MGLLAAAVAAFHVVKLAGLANNRRYFPTLRAVDPADEQSPRRSHVSILVPARNEARRLPDMLRHLVAQPADEILVLDDESTDATSDIAAGCPDSRVRLVTGRPKPTGWIGKNWACHQLAGAAAGDVLMFCDADVTLEVGALAAILRQMRDQQADVFSVFPRQTTVSLGERILVPLIDENLLAFLPFQLLSAPVPAAAVANGQTIVFARRAYQAIGGHAAVAGEIVEDLALARRARRFGFRLGLALGGELVSTRMYDGYVASIRGLGKSLRSAHGRSNALLVASAVFNLYAYTVPWLRLGRGRAWPAVAASGLVERILVNRQTGRRCYAEAALVPITAPAALPVYAVALRRTASWRGRTYR